MLDSYYAVSGSSIIEVEDKIIGPLTFKQFVFIAGGGGLAFMAWKWIPGGLFISAPFIVAGIAAGIGLAMGSYNERPITEAIESAFYFLIRGKMFQWNATHTLNPSVEKITSATTPPTTPTMSNGKIRELAWSLDIHEKIDRAEREKIGEKVQPKTIEDIMATIKTAQGGMVR